MRRQSRRFVVGVCSSASIFGHFEGQRMNLEKAKPNVARFPNADFAGSSAGIICGCVTLNLPHYGHSGDVMLTTLQC